jgi:prophage regulatory protein
MPIDRLLRLEQIIGRKADRKKDIPAVPAIIPVSRTCFLDRVKTGEFPRPVKIGRVTVWKETDIQRLVENLNA